MLALTRHTAPNAFPAAATTPPPLTFASSTVLLGTMETQLPATANCAILNASHVSTTRRTVCRAPLTIYSCN